MFDAEPSEIQSVRIPLVEIAATRTAFPTAEIRFELLLSVTDPLTGLSSFAGTLCNTTLSLGSLQCCGDGRIRCRLIDDPNADLGALARDLSRATDVKLHSWTTEIIRPTSSN